MYTRCAPLLCCSSANRPWSSRQKCSGHLAAELVSRRSSAKSSSSLHPLSSPTRKTRKSLCRGWDLMQLERCLVEGNPAPPRASSTTVSAPTTSWRTMQRKAPPRASNTRKHSLLLAPLSLTVGAHFGRQSDKISTMWARDKSENLFTLWGKSSSSSSSELARCSRVLFRNISSNSAQRCGTFSSSVSKSALILVWCASRRVFAASLKPSTAELSAAAFFLDVACELLGPAARLPMANE